MSARAWLHVGLVVVLLVTGLALPVAIDGAAATSGGWGAGPQGPTYTHDTQTLRTAIATLAAWRVVSDVEAPLLGAPISTVAPAGAHTGGAARLPDPPKSDPEQPGTGAAVR